MWTQDDIVCITAEGCRSLANRRREHEQTKPIPRRREIPVRCSFRLSLRPPICSTLSATTRRDRDGASIRINRLPVRIYAPSATNATERRPVRRINAFREGTELRARVFLIDALAGGPLDQEEVRELAGAARFLWSTICRVRLGLCLVCGSGYGRS